MFGLAIPKAWFMAAGALILAGIWMHGFSTGKGASEAKALRAQVASLERQMKVRDDTIAAHGKRAMRDAEALAAKDRKLREAQAYVDQIPDADCLSGDDARRLQSIFGAE